MDMRHHCARSIGCRTSNPYKISTEMASGCMTLVKSVCEAYFFYRNILSWWLSSDILTNNSKVVVPTARMRRKRQSHMNLNAVNQRSSLVLYTGFSDEQMQAIECSPYFIFFQLIGLLFLFQFF